MTKHSRRTFLQLGAIALVVGITFVKVFPFSSQLFGATVALGLAVLHGDGRVQRWFSVPDGWLRAIGWGIAGGIAVIAVDAALFEAYALAGLEPLKLDRFASIHGNLRELLIWLAAIWVIVGPTEELISRSFLIDQWQDVLPSRRSSAALSVALSAATFSAVHGYQGLSGLVSNFVAGVIFGVLYLFRGRTLASNCVAHSIADSVALTAIYCGWVA